MVVAAGAFEGQPEKSGAKRGDPVGDVGDAIFLLHHATLLILVVQAVKGGGESLFFCGLGQ